ncbi:hypothetical protein HanHA300_Chr12g0435841 [Helianthus annuus]|nr:hypothetical protein HanHA300_Chr12g0435841 [Helianthus annuus]
MPLQPAVDEVGNFLDHTKHLLQDFDDKQKAQIHLFASEDAPHYAWELEKIAMKYGLFCNKQIRIPWGGLKRTGFYYIVSFSFEGEEEEEEAEAEEEEEEGEALQQANSYTMGRVEADWILLHCFVFV